MKELCSCQWSGFGVEREDFWMDKIRKMTFGCGGQMSDLDPCDRESIKVWQYEMKLSQMYASTCKGFTLESSVCTAAGLLLRERSSFAWLKVQVGIVYDQKWMCGGL